MLLLVASTNCSLSHIKVFRNRGWFSAVSELHVQTAMIPTHVSLPRSLALLHPQLILAGTASRRRGSHNVIANGYSADRLATFPRCNLKAWMARIYHPKSWLDAGCCSPTPWCRAMKMARDPTMWSEVCQQPSQSYVGNTGRWTGGHRCCDSARSGLFTICESVHWF